MITKLIYNLTKTAANVKNLLTRPYTKIISLIFIGYFIISIVIPPLQSPDEHDHIKRAYLLSKGVIALDTIEGKSSGGYIDESLQRYIDSYGTNGVIKKNITSAEINSANSIEWSEDKIYSSAPGTGFYFPAIYIPQALGLWIGEFLNLSVHWSYRLARLLAMLTTAILLIFSFTIHKPNHLTLALISIPMTIYQMSSASLDGITIGLIIFIISTFLYVAKNKEEPFRNFLPIFTISISILITCRLYTLPVLTLLLTIFFYTRKRIALIYFAAATFFTIFWIAYTMSTIVDTRVLVGATSTTIILHYLTAPQRLLTVLWSTISNHDLQKFYYESFIGILGWLDTKFNKQLYILFGSLLLTIGILTTSLHNIKAKTHYNLILVFTSLTSILFVFLSLLVVWTVHPAQQIEGVQGRYFLIPLIIASYGLSDISGKLYRERKKIATGLLIVLYTSSILATLDLLIKRYYLSERPTETELIIFKNKSSTSKQKLIASSPLNKDNPITLKLPKLNNYRFGKITEINILFGTNIRKNLGRAELLLKSNSGTIIRNTIYLPELIDNAYKRIKVPEDYYTSGKILYLTGGGVSVWESHDNNDYLTCVKLSTTYNQSIAINGCP